MDVSRMILTLLKDGLNQTEIAEKLKQENIKPNSLSSVEKKIKDIKELYNAKTMFHLACILYSEEYFNDKVGT